jgi:hypothetical protein
MIRIVGSVKNVTIRDLSFQNVSSSCILMFGKNIQDINIMDNRADEFYEQFVEFGSGENSRIRIERNIVRSTRGHPKLGSTEPFGIAFEPKSDGEISTVSITDNHIYFDGMSDTEVINTGGVQLSTGPAKAYVYRRIVIKDNKIRTVGSGIRVETLRDGDVGGPGSVAIQGNHIEDARGHGIEVILARDDKYRDEASITDNKIRGYSAQAFNQYDGIRLAGHGTGAEIRGNEISHLTARPGGNGRYGINVEPHIQGAVIRSNKIAGYLSGAISNKGTRD